MTNCKYIDDYISLVRSEPERQCEYQWQLCDFVENIFNTEDIYVNEEQLEKYLGLQKYFPYKLFEWELFCFTLHNCTYKSDGRLRFPNLVVYVGRGAGKNGYLSFEDFVLLTPINGIKEYHIDIFATAEEQAKQSFNDIYNILEDNKPKMKRFFYWTKEIIKNLQTKSELRFKTSNAKTKDGGRPGKVDFDEYHAYEDYKLVDVAVTGLGKKQLPRRTIISTDGLIRGGPLDDLKEKCKKILNGESEDNGFLPFLCSLDDVEEVHNEICWHKPNPSLRYLPDLMDELKAEYSDYKEAPFSNISFITKRMNCPPYQLEGEIAKWEDILATNTPIDYDLIKGKPCVVGIDYAKTNDFVAAGLLFIVNEKHYWITHSWVCTQSTELSRVKAPLDIWAVTGHITFVNEGDISPETPVRWISQKALELGATILNASIDFYRYTWLKAALANILSMSAEKEFSSKVKLCRPSDEMKIQPIITRLFINHNFVWGDCPIMRWYANNSKLETDKNGNSKYTKIEPKSRKTDGFKALIAAEIIAENIGLENYVKNSEIFDDFMGCMTF